MAMLQVECWDCQATFSLRGWIEPEDLIGTQWAGYTKEEIATAEKENPTLFAGLDPWDKFDNDKRCPYCGSSNVVSF